MDVVSPPPSAYDAWVCPFCTGTATQSTASGGACDSRACACGAIGLAAPACDMDEILEDAVQIFGVAIREDTRLHDSMRQQDVRMPGIEVRHGRTVPVGQGAGRIRDFMSLWFLRASTR
jgi:hypothetical protein